MTGVTGHRSDEDAGLGTFTVRLPRWRFMRLFGFNPLVRISDRVEAFVLVLAVVVCFLPRRSPPPWELRSTTPAAANTPSRPKLVKCDRHSHRPQGRLHDSLGPTITVLARWFAAGTEHTGPVSTPPGVKTGDSIDIWVGEDGSHVGPPPKTAYDEAVAVASAIWFSVAIVAGVLVAGTRAALNRAHHAQWQDDFDNLVGDGDGHTSEP